MKSLPAIAIGLLAALSSLLFLPRLLILGFGRRWREASQGNLALAQKMLFSIAIVLANMLLNDPLGVGAATARHSRDLFYQIAGPHYAGSETRTDLPRSSVVLITDGALPTLSPTGWPISYSGYAELIAAILERRPQALFIDLLFIDPRRDAAGIADLAAALAQARDPDPVPVVLAAAPLSQPQAEHGILNALHPDRLGPHVRLATPVTSPLAGIGRHSADDSHQTYNLAAFSPDAGAGIAPLHTPAYILLELMCQRLRMASCDSATAGQALDPAAFQRQMEVFWGAAPRNDCVGPDWITPCTAANRSSLEQRPRWLPGCRDLPQDIPTRLLRLVLDGSDALRDSCAYTPALHADHVLAMHHPAIDARIAGRVVFLGLSLAGMADDIAPPNSHRLAGVFLHAMAFDNLLAYGRRYIGDSDAWLGLPAEAYEVLLVVLVHVIVLTAMVLLRHRLVRDVPDHKWQAMQHILHHMRQQAGAYALIFGILIGCAGLLVAAVAIEVMGLRLSPANWMGLLGLLALTAPLASPVDTKTSAAKQEVSS